MPRRMLTLLYGIFCYLGFLLTLLYLIGFLGNFAVPKSIDAGPTGSATEACLIDIALLAIFGIQHSVMARPWFKSLWTRVVPQQVERSTYVLLTNLALALLFWQWRPIPGVVWEVADPLGQLMLYGLFAIGWLLVVVSTFVIDHFGLFGMRQVVEYFKGTPHVSDGFKTPWLYRVVRHPLYVGWLIAFWATPHMTYSHLLFSVGTTAYILLAIQFEERDLLRHHGEDYRKYQQQVPMLIPLRFPKG